MNFDLTNVRVTEFGIGRDGDNAPFVLVPVDEGVQAALREMVDETWKATGQNVENPAKYEPSEKHATKEYLYLETNDPMAAFFSDLYQAVNLSIDGSVLGGPSNISCYFAQLTDDQNRRLTALKRAAHFKGILKSRVIQISNDTLKMVKDDLFKLDNDFDLLIDSEKIHILRPSAFELMGGLTQAILGAVPTNVKAVQRDMPFVDFEAIESYVSKHPRAARYLASIREQNLADIDPSALKKLCEKTGVKVEKAGRKITVSEEHIMGFLEVLDRRRYEIDLVPEAPESFKAASRHKIN